MKKLFVLPVQSIRACWQLAGCQPWSVFWTHRRQRTEDMRQSVWSNSLCWYETFEVGLVCQEPLYKRKESWKDCSLPNTSSFYKWGLILISSVKSWLWTDLHGSLEPVSLPGTLSHVKGRIKDRERKLRQWMMERLTGEDTVSRGAESETNSVKTIKWNKNNGFSSFKADWTFGENRE